MIVAIVQQGTGQVLVEEFRSAVGTSEAVGSFCGEYTPPKNEGDYIGVDTGWTLYQYPPALNRWAFDHNTELILAVTE